MNYPLFLLSVLVIAITSIFTACEKDDLTVSDTATEVTYTTELPAGTELITDLPGVSLRKDTADVPTDCPYQDCKALIQAIIEYYKPLVKSTCKEIKKAVECCSGGNLVYAVIKIKPPPDCAYPDPIFDENNKKQALLTARNGPSGKTDVLKDAGPECNLPNCKSKIAELKAIYQPLVDASCKRMSFRVHCCEKGQYSKKYLILTPDPGGCFITDTDGPFKGKKKF